MKISTSVIQNIPFRQTTIRVVVDSNNNQTIGVDAHQLDNYVTLLRSTSVERASTFAMKNPTYSFKCKQGKRTYYFLSKDGVKVYKQTYSAVFDIGFYECFLKYLHLNQDGLITLINPDQNLSIKSSVEKFTDKVQKDFLGTEVIGQSIVSENKYLWAKIAEMEQKQLKYLIGITEPYNQTPAY